MTYSNKFSSFLRLREKRLEGIGDPREAAPRTLAHFRPVAEAPKQQARRRRPLRSGHGVGESAQSARHAFARLLIEHLLDHLHHAVHLRAAADDDDAASDFLVQPDLLDVA